MKCTQCGSMIGPTSASCATCGRPVTTVAPIEGPPAWSHGIAPPPTAGPPSAATAPPPPAAQEDPWAIPAPGAEWNVPGFTSAPTAQTPAQPYGYGYSRPRDAGSGYSIAGIVCGVVALLFCPIVMGLIGLGLASKASSRGESLAGTARLVSIVGLVGGMIIGVLMYTRL